MKNLHVCLFWYLYLMIFCFFFPFKFLPSNRMFITFKVDMCGFFIKCKYQKRNIWRARHMPLQFLVSSIFHQIQISKEACASSIFLVFSLNVLLQFLSSNRMLSNKNQQICYILGFDDSVCSLFINNSPLGSSKHIIISIHACTILLINV